MYGRRPRLQAQRKAAGFTQESLSYALGNDRTTVARWESGVTEPEAWIGPKLARMLGVSADRLAELLVPEPIDVASRGFVRPGSGRVDPAAIRSLTTQVAAIAKRYETEPSTALVAEAGQSHDSAMFLLAQGGNEHTQRQLAQPTGLGRLRPPGWCGGHDLL
ncbi:hypothetical protein GCM10009609_00250 [Pseudonocardia aurantiaca]|uniref:Helix-turn-helix transcriptional regulator n=1 Tax=Pseudonocardia aurantiaca TaxID=75290 RepID=A0ABW4FCI7_9PSEU